MADFRLEKIDNGYEDFLKDESKKIGTACSISFPATEAEVSATLSYMAQNGVPVTVQGGRTGIAAGAVPDGGHILNLGRMDRVTGLSYDAGIGSYIISLQPGVVLSSLREMLAEKKFDTGGWSGESLNALEAFRNAGEWFFPTDPTEASATLGGIVACNSSGACSFHYGPARRYIKALDLVLADGSQLRLARGAGTSSNRDGSAKSGDSYLKSSFSVESADGRQYQGRLPSYAMPAVKNASGYYTHEDMDPIDLFIGSEGTLGVVTGITLRLLPKPAYIWGMTALLKTEAQVPAFVRRLREAHPGGVSDNEAAVLAALEYFNGDSLKLLKRFKSENASFSSVPDIPDGIAAAVYAEIHADSEDAAADLVMDITDILEQCGGSGDDTWFAGSDAEMEKLHAFRHAVPEAVNLTIADRKRKHPGLTKLGTDMAVPDERLPEVMEMYDRDLAAAGLESVIFGHIGDNHLHVNILPRSSEEYEKGWELYHSWAQRIIAMGGTISAEHGVGKLKTALLEHMYGKAGIDQMKEVKKIFDPYGILSPGNLFG